MLETFILGTQWQPLQGELGLNVWFAEASFERTDGHMSKGSFSAFRLGSSYPQPPIMCWAQLYSGTGHLT